MERLRSDRGAIMQTLTYCVLGFVWLLVLQQFFGAMAGRVTAIFVHDVIANTPPCYSPECDFSMYWPAGLLARARDFNTLYNTAAFQLWRQHVLFAGVQRLDWFYPPPSLLPVLVIAYLPFNTAFVVWTLCLALAAAMILHWAGLGRRVILLSLLSPASLWNIEMGQLEIFCGACVVAGLLMAGTAPLRAGGLLGLLIFKPQMGLLAPFGLLARRNVRGLIAGAVLVALLIDLVTFMLGPNVWVQYLGHGLSASRQTLIAPHPVGAERGVSVFWMMRSFGAGVQASYAVQGVAVLGALAATWAAWRRPDIGNTHRMALTVFLSLLTTPYGYVDDMVAYSIALAALAQMRGWRIDLLDVLFWLWPALCPIVTGGTGILLTPVIVLAATARTWRRAGLGLPHLPRAALVLPRAG